MSTQIIKVLIPPPVAEPRGAEWASVVVTTLARIGRRVWHALEAAAQARAQRELHRRGLIPGNQSEAATTLRDAMHRAAMHRDSQH